MCWLHDPMPEQELTAPQRAMVETWERHMAAEFDTKSPRGNPSNGLITRTSRSRG